MTILKVDLDIPYSYFQDYEFLAKFAITRVAILKALNLTPTSIVIKPSKHNTHIKVRVKEDLSLRDIFVIQYFLGDDAHRFLYNMMRLRYWGEDAKYFNILFSKKYKVKVRKVRK